MTWTPLSVPTVGGDKGSEMHRAPCSCRPREELNPWIPAATTSPKRSLPASPCQAVTSNVATPGGWASQACSLRIAGRDPPQECVAQRICRPGQPAFTGVAAWPALALAPAQVARCTPCSSQCTRAQLHRSPTWLSSVPASHSHCHQHCLLSS